MYPGLRESIPIPSCLLVIIIAFATEMFLGCLSRRPSSSSSRDPSSLGGLWWPYGSSSSSLSSSPPSPSPCKVIFGAISSVFPSSTASVFSLGGGGGSSLCPALNAMSRGLVSSGAWALSLVLPVLDFDVNLGAPPSLDFLALCGAVVGCTTGVTHDSVDDLASSSTACSLVSFSSSLYASSIVIHSWYAWCFFSPTCAYHKLQFSLVVFVFVELLFTGLHVVCACSHNVLDIRFDPQLQIIPTDA